MNKEKPILITHYIDPERFDEYLVNLKDMDTGRLDQWGSIMAECAEYQAETQRVRDLTETTYVHEKDIEEYNELKKECKGECEECNCGEVTREVITSAIINDIKHSEKRTNDLVKEIKEIQESIPTHISAPEFQKINYTITTTNQ